MNEQREDRLRRTMEAMGENTKAKTIDRALQHYLADLRNKRRVADDLPTDLAEELSTPYLRIERETIVNPSDE